MPCVRVSKPRGLGLCPRDFPYLYHFMFYGPSKYCFLII